MGCGANSFMKQQHRALYVGLTTMKYDSIENEYECSTFFTSLRRPL